MLAREIVTAQGFSTKQFRSLLSQLVEAGDPDEAEAAIVDARTGSAQPALHVDMQASDVPCPG
jgi:hypothetical protein